MLKKYLKSLNGKIYVTVTAIYFIGIIIGMLLESQLSLIATFLYLPTSVWPWISNKKYSVIFLSWFYQKLYPIELISFDNDRYYTLAAKYDVDKMTAPVYFSTGIGQVILLENGTVDNHSESRYITHWLPLNKNDRTLHILKYDIPA